MAMSGCWGERSLPGQPDASPSVVRSDVDAPTGDTSYPCSSIPCVASEPCVQTLAGGAAGYLDGPSTTARFNHPWSVAVDAQGWVYVGDEKNGRIRVIHDGAVSTLAGSSNTSGSPDGPADKAYFKGIQGIDVDATGAVYVAERESRKVRVVSQGYVSTMSLGGTGKTFDPVDVAMHGGALHVVDLGNINCSTCAARWPPYIGRVEQGKLTPLPESYTLDPATIDLGSPHWTAQPQAVAVGGDGKIYMPTPKGIRVLSPSGATLREIEIYKQFGLGLLFELADLAVDSQGRLVAALAFYHRVALLDSDDRPTVIPPLPEDSENGLVDQGCVDGPASVARFRTPQGVAVDPSGRRIYVADTGNARIRVIELR